MRHQGKGATYNFAVYPAAVQLVEHAASCAVHDGGGGAKEVALAEPTVMTSAQRR